jgi:hypothetical protein
MSGVLVPTNTTDAFWSQVTTLDGTDYQLDFSYNSREAVYYLSFYDTSGNLLYGGLKLVSNFPLLRTVISSVMPGGELVAISTTTDDSPAALGELGPTQRVQLWYFPELDVINAGVEPWRNPGFFVPATNA